MPDDRDHIWDMLQAVSLIEQFVDSITEDRYLSDKMLQSAVERQVEIIGEAANRV